jgi:oleate hydratase
LFPDRKGQYVDRTMAEATGQEILTELLGQLGWSEMADTVAASTTVIPVMMPYITSQFARRSVGDRPLVVPEGAANFAFLGQFTEIPEDVVFTVEYSVRGAMQAVYALTGIDKPIPDVYQGIADPRVALTALRTAFSQRSGPAQSAGQPEVGRTTSAGKGA